VHIRIAEHIVFVDNLNDSVLVPKNVVRHIVAPLSFAGRGTIRYPLLFRFLISLILGFATHQS
jgi:hypothetical protein